MVGAGVYAAAAGDSGDREAADAVRADGSDAVSIAGRAVTSLPLPGSITASCMSAGAAPVEVDRTCTWSTRPIEQRVGAGAGVPRLGAARVRAVVGVVGDVGPPGPGARGAGAGLEADGAVRHLHAGVPGDADGAVPHHLLRPADHPVQPVAGGQAAGRERLGHRGAPAERRGQLDLGDLGVDRARSRPRPAARPGAGRPPSRRTGSPGLRWARWRSRHPRRRG